MKSKDSDLIEQMRAAHHAALKAMLPPGDPHNGRAVWRRLRIVELAVNRAAVQLSNVGLSEDEQDRVRAHATSKVTEIFGRPLPGFFVNWDPRGYALKLQPKSVPYDLHTDWGGYQILAPSIDQA